MTRGFENIFKIKNSVKYTHSSTYQSTPDERPYTQVFQYLTEHVVGKVINNQFLTINFPFFSFRGHVELV